MPKNDGSKVLIYRLGSLGDTIVALPCFHQIMKAFPHSERIALTNRPVSSKAAPLEIILRDGGFIHRSIDYDVGVRDPRKLFGLAQRIRAERCDTLVYVGGGRGLLSVYRDVAFFRLCGIKHIIGAPLRSDLASNSIDSEGVVEAEAQRLARCLAQLGDIDVEDPATWDLIFTEAEIARAAEIASAPFDRGFIAVNTGGKVIEKDWGEQNWIEFIKVLSRKTDLPLVFVGGAEDSPRAKILGDLWSAPWLDACGALAPRETGALLRRALFFVGHDSGPMHLAAAAGTPCIGLFGVINKPRKWHPIGAQHIILHDTAGVERLTVAAVNGAVNEMMVRTGQNGAGPLAVNS